MHVPTVVSYSSLQQLTAEQIVHIPVPGGDGGGGRGGLQGSLPRQNSAALHVEQTVDIPVPGRAGEGGRGLQGFAGQSSTASSSHVSAAHGAGQGGFSHFSPKEKSAMQGPHSGSELSADFNPSTLSAHQMPPEQLVDVPVPQVHERTSYEQETRLLLESLHRRWEAEEAARLVPVEEEQMDEEEEGGRGGGLAVPSLTSVLVVGAWFARSRQQQQQQGSNRFVLLFWRDLLLKPSGRHVGAW